MVARNGGELARARREAAGFAGAVVGRKSKSAVSGAKRPRRIRIVGPAAPPLRLHISSHGNEAVGHATAIGEGIVSFAVDQFTNRVISLLIDKVKGRLGSFDPAAVDLDALGSPEDVAESMAAVLPMAHPFDTAIGPFHDVSGVARRLHVSEDEIHQRVVQNQLLACTTTDGALLYPAFQFRPDGSPLPGLEPVLTSMALGTKDRWQVALWMTTPSDQLQGQAPNEALSDGRTKAVQKLADQTADRWRH